MEKTFSLLLQFFPFVAAITFFCSFLPLYAGGIGIKSETEFQCVNLILWLEDNPNKTEADAPLSYQKTRTTVGIGETVNLTVVGDESSIGRKEDIKWEIDRKDDCATFLIEAVRDTENKKNGTETEPKNTVTKVEGKESVVLGIRLGKSEMDNQEVTVSVKTGTGKVAEKKFTIRTPNGKFLSRHLNPPRTAKIVPTKGQTGASTTLRVFLLPGSVNFSGGVGVIEENQGAPLDVKPKKSDESGAAKVEESTFKNFFHNTAIKKGTVLKKPWDFFEVGVKSSGAFLDNIYFRRYGKKSPAKPSAILDYKNMKAVHSCYWKCGWYWREIYSNDGKLTVNKPEEYGEEMDTVNQHFSVQNDGKGTATISKFNSSVTREAESSSTKQTYK